MSKNKTDSRSHRHHLVEFAAGVGIAITGTIGIGAGAVENYERIVLSGQLVGSDATERAQSAITTELQQTTERQWSDILSGLGCMALGIGSAAAAANRMHAAYSSPANNYYPVQIWGMTVEVSTLIDPAHPHNLSI